MPNTKINTGPNIPVFNAQKEYQELKPKLHRILDEVGERGQWILGPKVVELEEKLSAVSCASGTDAITLTLLALGIKSGDEVLLPANSYPSVFGVVAAGAAPKLVDINPETGLIDWQQVAVAITPQTKAVLAVHLYGNVCAIPKIPNLHIIEDCAQAFGATDHGKPVGHKGIAGILSFYPTKNLGAYGDGGAVITNSKKLATSIKAWRMYGESSRYRSEFPGKNSRLDELQAAFMLEKLKHLPRWLRQRRTLAARYDAGLQNLPFLRLIPRQPGAAPHLYVVRTPYRNRLQQHLAAAGVGTAIHYPVPIHKTPAFFHFKGTFPEAEKWSNQVLSLPFYPQLTAKEVDRVIAAITTFKP